MKVIDVLSTSGLAAGTEMNNRVTIDRYSDFKPIGVGGFSRVYKAWRADQERYEAIKVLSLGSRKEIDRDTFTTECRAMGALSTHPHVVTVYDNGFTNEGYPFISMEFCQASLADRIEEAANRCLPVEDVLDIGSKIFGALGSAHRKGILHRDLKPQNILFTDYHDPVLTDFGIASLSDDPKSQRSWALSRHYAAPEVLDDERHNESCDIYSLGATLYTALAGRRPFFKKGHNDEDALEHRIRTEPPPPIDAQQVPAFVEDFIIRLIAKHPRDRPPTADDAARELGKLQHRLGVHPAAIRGESSREHDQTELRKKRPKTHSTAPVEDATTSDPTRTRTDTGYRPTTDFKAPTKSKRPLITAAVVAAVATVGIGGLALSQIDGTDGSGPGPSPTSVLEEATTGITPDVIPRAPDAPVATRTGNTVRFEWNDVDSADEYRVDPTTLGLPSQTVDRPQITFELEDDGVLCIVVHAVGKSNRVSRGSEQACA